jgi:hypothetical protein
MDNSGWNMYVFRDGRRILPGQRLTDAVIGSLTALNFCDEECALATLIATGELECALKDSDHPQAALAEQITDGIAEGLVRQTWGEDSPSASFLSRRRQQERHSLARTLLPSPTVGRSGSVPTAPSDPRTLTHLASQIRTERDVRISVLEGFAYYALHPRKILRILDSLNLGPRVAVVGIRSIGAPLSAVLAASLRERGMKAERITVRPTGHPYDRTLALGAQESEWVSAHANCEFMLIDEGPGLSGSSFLATAEALVATGISARRIRIIGSRQPDVSQLRTSDACHRWPRFGFYCLQSEPIMPADAAVPIGAGLWRREFLTSFEDQPASWTALEMAKFLSHDRRRVHKFEGFGHFGRDIAERVRALHETGFTTDHHGNNCGFGSYDIERGRMLSRNDLSTALIHRIADYCSVRAKEVSGDNTQPSQLSEMLQWNWQTEFGRDLPSRFADLAVEFPTICDARMAPHEWFELDDGRVLKLDCGSHGDDHFFPGPCDIAWDLAGAVVEWRMEPQAREALIERYEQQSKDRARSRLAAYELAYAVFRMAWSKMAAEANAGQFDEQLLRRDYLRYREQALELAAEPAHKPELVPGSAPLPLPEGSAA